MNKIFLVLTIVFLLCAQLISAEEILLKYQYDETPMKYFLSLKGVSTTSVAGSVQKLDIDTEIMIDQKSIGKDAEGNIKIFNQIKQVNSIMNGEMTNIFQGPKEYTITMSPQGKIVSAEGLPENLNLNQLQINFPEKPIKIGDTWANSFTVQAAYSIPMKAEYKLEDIVMMNGISCAKIKSEVNSVPSVNDKVKMNTKASGVIYFDWKNGKIVKNVVTSFMDLRMPAQIYGEEHIILINMFLTMTMELK